MLYTVKNGVEPLLQMRGWGEGGIVITIFLLVPLHL
jgi:hypothetical protein